MKKELLLATVITLMAANTGFASPLTDYSAGKVAVDLTWESPKIHEDNHNDDNGYDYAKDNHLGYGVTAGLGNNFAIQYKAFQPESKATPNGWDQDTGAVISTYKEKINVKEYNVLYKLNTNVAVFTGMAQVKVDINTNGVNDSDYDSSDSTEKKNIWQVGFVGTQPLNDKTSAYAVAAAGQDMTALKLGVSYAMEKNLDLDVFYMCNTYKNVSWQDIGSSDFTAKGMGYGVTYKF